MESSLSDTLALLGHPQRLALLGLLMRRHPDRVPAGEIAAVLRLPPSTASAHLAALARGGLIAPLRQGTSLRYGLRLQALRALADGLVLGCFRGRADLAPALPPLTPQRTQAMDRTAPAPARPFNVLFVCAANSARSLFAEAILAQLGAGGFRAFSAGMSPAAAPDPVALETLRGKGHAVGHLRPKPLAAFQGPEAPVMDFVFTVCDLSANEDCGTWPGQPVTGHWGVPDPVKATGTAAERRLAFQQAYGRLRHRIAAFVSLPVARLDRVSLQRRIDAIGQDAAAEGAA
ncbi:MAG: helix-turn-helix domain-containing protein [Rhodobacteraceae bacterium]|jgi:arsenate reductase|nr:helix-turn-helix domain-containing protein [Paracoccaceae bacterium]